MRGTDIIYNFQEKMAYVGAADNGIPSLWVPGIAPPYVIMPPVTKNALSHLCLTLLCTAQGKCS